MKRPGKGDAFTPTKHAPRFHYRPRWQRTVIRTGSTVAFILILYGLVVNRRVTIICLQVTAGVLLILGCWRAWLRLQQRKHRRTWVEPVHAIVARACWWPPWRPCGS